MTLGTAAGVDGADPTWGNGGLTFDGINDSAGDASPPTTTDFTLIGVGTTTNLSTHRIFASRGGYNAGYEMRLEPSGKLQILIQTDGSNFTLAASSGAASLGVPCFMVARRLGLSIGIGIGGITNSVTSSVSPAITTPLRVGTRQNAPTLHWAGQQFFCLLYSRALADDEIARIYRALRKNLAQRGVTLP